MNATLKFMPGPSVARDFPELSKKSAVFRRYTWIYYSYVQSPPPTFRFRLFRAAVSILSLPLLERFGGNAVFSQKYNIPFKLFCPAF